MKKGPVVTAIISLLAMAGVFFAFLTNASPYVTIAQARQSRGDRLHLLGAIVKDSISSDLASRSLSFRLKDPEGATVVVRHVGELPANLSEATSVVAIGSMKDGEFVSEQLLLKCPSKYEGQPKPGDVNQKVAAN